MTGQERAMLAGKDPEAMMNNSTMPEGSPDAYRLPQSLSISPLTQKPVMSRTLSPMPNQGSTTKPATKTTQPGTPNTLNLAGPAAQEQASLQRPIPADILEAERALSVFDWASEWGPKSSVTRFERLARGCKYSKPAGWDWVDDILRRFPALGDLKAHEKLQTGTHNTVTRPTQYEVVATPCAKQQPIAPAGTAPTRVPESWMLTDQLPPRGTSTGKQQPFRRTLPNVGNTCFFNSVLQVIASLPAFVTEIEQIPLPPDHADSSYCLAFLKLFIPAIVSPTSLPSHELNLSSVQNGGGWMTRAD